jgi:hypothetical protein
MFQLRERLRDETSVPVVLTVIKVAVAQATGNRSAVKTLARQECLVIPFRIE